MEAARTWRRALGRRTRALAWRQRFAERLAVSIDPARFGANEIYLYGSTEVGNAGIGSDIDLIVVWSGNAQQKRDLENWLEGWSLCVAEVSFQLYGLPSSGLLDVRFIDPEQAKTEIRAFGTAGTTLQLLPVGAAADQR